MNMKMLIEKYRDVIFYIIFGAFTTLVNLIVYWWMSHVLKQDVMFSAAIAWIAAVLFAYITNKKWVFHSEAASIHEIGKELAAFFTCRLATGAVDLASMFVFTDLLHFNDIVIKALANLIVIILNYIASKLVIFKH